MTEQYKCSRKYYIIFANATQLALAIIKMWYEKKRRHFFENTLCKYMYYYHIIFMNNE